MDLVSAPAVLVATGLVPGRHYWLVGGRVLPRLAGAEDDDKDDEKKDDKTDEKKDDEQQTFSKEYVDALRQESGGYRTKLRDLESKHAALEARLVGLESTGKTDEEKRAQELKDATAKVEAAERRAREVAVQAAVERAARKLNLVDEEVAVRLLDHDKLEFDDKGVPINAETLLQELVKAKPFLVGGDGGDKGKKGVPGTPKNGGSDGQSRDDLVKKSKEELAASGRYVL